MVTYEEKREQLLGDISDMSEIAEDMLQKAIEALEEKKVGLAKDVINRDDVLDNYQITTAEEVSQLLSMEKPLVSGSWFAIALIRIANDLERIGDYATNIAETVLELKNEEYLHPMVMIPELADVVLAMLDTVLEAFVTRNADLAEAVCRKDESADNIHDQIYDRAIKIINDKTKSRENVNQIVRFINVAKSLERIGDHATNIGEETIFIVTGKRVKY
ncbi:MAG: phosphate signaling complex protein PhoU [Halanaerobiaceae bacterium]